LYERDRVAAHFNGRGVQLNIRGTAMEFPLENKALAGPHGAQNLMAACLCATAVGCPLADIEAAARAFSGLEHRMEFVGKLEGRQFINDSKATNVGAVIPALEACDEPVVLIAGGEDKGIDFTPLRDPVRRKARAVVLLGEAAQRLSHALSGTAPIHMVQSMDEAVDKAMALAEPGDRVLLSPACSSFDQYRNYEERGQDFRRAFHRLAYRR
jgi:UDP-N-acetylmuramoylalanine--D-glutamate ligase